MGVARRIYAFVVIMVMAGSVLYAYDHQQNFALISTPTSSTSLSELNCPGGSHQLNESCVANGGTTTVSPLPSAASGNAGGTPNGGGGSCFGCVTITDISGNVVNSRMNSVCYIPNSNWGPLGMVIGPNVQGSARTFRMQFTIAAASGAACENSDDVYNVYLENSNLIPVYILSVSPSLPYNVLSGTSQVFTVTFQALDGNPYNGALVLTIQISGD